MINCLQHHTQWAKTASIPLKIRNKTGMSLLTSFIQHSTGSPSHSDLTRRSKKHPNWRGKSKTVIISRRHNTAYRGLLRFHQETTRTDKFSKIAGYKINI